MFVKIVSEAPDKYIMQIHTAEVQVRYQKVLISYWVVGHKVQLR